MNSTNLALIVVPLCAVTSFGATYLLQAPREAPLELADVETSRDTAALIGRLRALEVSVSELQGSLDAANAVALPDAEERREPNSLEIEIAVENWLASQLATARASAPNAGTDSPYADLSSEAFLRMLDETRGADRYLLWQAAREAGREAELVAHLEERVRVAPNDTGANYDLASGYMQMRFGETDIVRGMKWSVLADDAYGRTLELDPEHFHARFSKATALSLWPVMKGKTGEAIGHFERLTKMQPPPGAEGRQADAFLYLGNLRMRTGDQEGAAAAWREGAGLFPADGRLSAQLGLLRGR